MTEDVRGSGAVRRPVTVLMAVLTLLVVGLLAYTRVPLQLMPAGLTQPQLTIWVPLPDSTPTEVMEEVTRPIEEQLRTVPGLTDVRSRSNSNECSVTVEYGVDQDPATVYADIQDRLERLVPILPDGAERFRIFRFNLDTDLPIIFMAISFDEEVRDPDVLLENVVQPRIEGVEGVARVTTMGMVTTEVEIELDPARVNALGVNLQTLVNRLQADNSVEPLGVVEEDGTRQIVRLSGRFDDFDQIRNFPVRQSLLLGEIARVQERRGLQDFLARVDGRICRLVQVSKESDANTVDTCARLQEELERMGRDPRTRGVSFLPWFDQGKQIEAAVGSVRKTSLWGGLFAVLVLLLFLRQVRLTLLVSTVIPLAVLGAVTVLFFRSGTFNVLSLAGLTLSIGMLVDNAIVVAENIFRHRQLGATAVVAATRGVREVALSVTLATLTTVAVFLPLMFLISEGQIHVAAMEIGLPISYALISSLLISLVAVPVATCFIQAQPRPTPRWLVTLGALHRAVLSWCLRHPALCAFFSVLLLSSVGIAAMLMNTTGRATGGVSQLQVEVSCPPFYTLTETDQVMERLRQSCEPIRDEFQIETIACWYQRRGGMFACFMKPGARKTREQFLERLQALFPQIAGVEYSFNQELSDEKQVYIEARGRDPKHVTHLLEQMRDRLRPEPGVLQVELRRDSAPEEIVVEVERDRAQRYGVSMSSVSSLVSWALRGAPIADFHAAGGEQAMWVRFAGSELENIGDLYRVPIYSQDGKELPVATVADFSVERGLAGVRRRAGQVYDRMSVHLSANVDNRRFAARVDQAISELEIAEGYTVELAGRSLRGEAGFAELWPALAVAVLLIFIIMGVLFESVVLPMAVLISVPSMFIGGAWFLFIFDTPMGPVVAIGCLLLLGIVVNNAIVLVDCINRYRQEQSSRFEAILRAGEDRLRPILMTASTTIFGLIPLTVAPFNGEGIDYRVIGIVVMGGLLSATLFTVTVVPVGYAVLDDLRQMLRNGWRGARRLLPGGESD